jgi:hypothetical protein
VRRANFYGTDERNVTPYGQTVTDNVVHELVDELARSSDYAARREAVARFNAASPVLKKGLALTPVKFGISFNVNHLNQAGALVHVYTDGSVLVNHGGTEMGQGLNTKVAQVVAHELGLPLARVRCTATDTQQGGQHLGHRRLHRQRPQRQGGAGRGAADPRAAGRACAARWGVEPPRCVSRAACARRRAHDMASTSWWPRPTWRACSCGATASTPRRA